jgi:hypothetical protein
VIWNDKKWVTKTPVVTVILLEGGNIQQLIRMWTERSSEGQSFWGWLQVNAALWLWWNFYRVMTPESRSAYWSPRTSIGINALVMASVLYFRYS